MQNEKYLLARIPDDPWIPVDPQSTKSPNLGLRKSIRSKKLGENPRSWTTAMKIRCGKICIFVYHSRGYGGVGWGDNVLVC